MFHFIDESLEGTGGTFGPAVEKTDGKEDGGILFMVELLQIIIW